MNNKVATIRTSDTAMFRACRRKWAFGSHLKGNWEPQQKASPLWFGSGIHFALEMFYLPVNPFKTLKGAFQAYAKATKQYSPKEMPDDYDDLLLMGDAMCDYYENHWLEGRDPLPTYILDGVPQVEVPFKVELPLDEKVFEGTPYNGAVFSATLDRVAYDEIADALWVVEYKTAKRFATAHFLTDDQVSKYSWAASIIYDKPVLGVVYQQHLKTIPKGPKQLKNGTFSVASNQVTTYRLYKDALIKEYGNIAEAPKANQDFLTKLGLEEDENFDRYVRRDYVYRNEHAQQAAGARILLEAEDMLNPNLPLYPNPTRDCSWMCSFQNPCISMEDGGYWEDELKEGFQQRTKSYDPWREHIDRLLQEVLTDELAEKVVQKTASLISGDAVVSRLPPTDPNYLVGSQGPEFIIPNKEE